MHLDPAIAAVGAGSGAGAGAGAGAGLGAGSGAGADSGSGAPRAIAADDAAPDDVALEALLSRVAGGEESALRALYERTCRRVFGLALHILRDRTAAEDVVLEVYVQVWRQAERFDAGCGSALAWLCTLARTRAIDLYRSRARRSRRETRLEDDAPQLLDSAPGPLEQNQGREHAGALRVAVLSLPAEQRRVIEAAYFGGLSHTEVAAALGQPLGTVKTRIRAGLQSLRRALAGQQERFA